MLRRRLTIATLPLLFCIKILAQSHSGFPVDISAGSAAWPVRANGHTHLLYELHLTNYASLPIELTRMDVFARNTTPLATYDGHQLDNMVVPVEKLSLAESPSESKGSRAIGEGHAVLIFLDITLNSAGLPPTELHHRFSFSVARKNKPDYLATIDGAIESIVSKPTPALRAPLRGAAWVAFNALGSEDHRRSLNALDGRERIPQRFAIDWMRMGPDGHLFHGDKNTNANFYGYGAEILAVAEGQISELKDGIPDNIGTSERSARAITLDNVFGNYLVLGLGEGRFAVYAHLQPGSLKVKVGDRVTAGQVLALLGNSGNSDQPHLHFHLVDGGSPMGAEGIPYELDTFIQLGLASDDPAVVDNDGVLLSKSQEKPVVHRHEFPVNNAVVQFP